MGAGGQGGGAPISCKHDAPGKAFKFHIHNKGTRKLQLNYSCGYTPSMYIDTVSGSMPVEPAPGSNMSNGLMCDPIFQGGSAPSAYGDCGLGYGAILDPGTTVDFDWDRRVYEQFSVPAECSGHPNDNGCWLGTAVAPKKAQTGVFNICPHQSMTEYSYCPDEEKTPVTFDSTGDEVTIEVM
jgi:hypothetical protein